MKRYGNMKYGRKAVITVILLALGATVGQLFLLWLSVPLSSADMGGEIDVTHLIENPGFEAPFTQRDNGPLWVAQGWEFFFLIGDPPHEHVQGPTSRPEYKGAYVGDFPYRVYEGDWSQVLFSFYKVHDAGLRQVVEVEEGAVYQVSAMLQAWGSNSDDPLAPSGETYVGIGIDPWGRSDPWELGVIWTNWQWVENAETAIQHPDNFKLYESVPVQAQSDQITIFIRTWNKWKYKHADYMVDNVRMVQLAMPQDPCPTPGLTATPGLTPTPIVGICPGLAEIEGMFVEVLGRMRLEVFDD